MLFLLRGLLTTPKVVITLIKLYFQNRRETPSSHEYLENDSEKIPSFEYDSDSNGDNTALLCDCRRSIKIGILGNPSLLNK